MTMGSVNKCSWTEKPTAIAVISFDGNRRANLEATPTDKFNKRFAATDRTR